MAAGPYFSRWSVMRSRNSDQEYQLHQKCRWAELAPLCASAHREGVFMCTLVAKECIHPLRSGVRADDCGPTPFFRFARMRLMRADLDFSALLPRIDHQIFEFQLTPLNPFQGLTRSNLKNKRVEKVDKINRQQRRYPRTKVRDATLSKLTGSGSH